MSPDHAFPRLGPGALTLLTVPLHFGYGAGAGALYSFLARPMSLGRGFALGFALWIIMQILFVPLLHLCYGGTLGWLGGHDDLQHHSQFDEADRLRVA